MEKQKIRIKIKSFDSSIIDSAVKQIVNVVITTGAKIGGPIPLPTKRSTICLHRSPHVNAKSKEHITMKTHRRLLDIIDPTDRTMDSLTYLQLAAGVYIELSYI